ncbi:hypothetical protein [Streptomyces sp. ODS28]|uniref:hypothetical protein n=1 Tax=Streptomyces sp. ODS28 TaxID=3136688 RepID=UPI0031EC3778
MARPESGKRIMGWAAAATLLATAPLMAACSGGSDDSGGSGSSSASDSKSPSASDGSGGSGGSSGDGGGSGSQAGDQSTVSSTVGSWVSAVIEKDAKRACLLSKVPDSSPPKAPSPKTCDAATTKKMAVGLKHMSGMFRPASASGKPDVKVDAPTPKGDKAVVPTADIKVDGKQLRESILSRSKGVDPKSFTAKVKTVKIDDKWYVDNFDMNM